MTRVAADFWPEQGATKEHTVYGPVTEEQRRSGRKAARPFGRKQFEASSSVAHSLQIHEGYAPRSRLAIRPNLLPRGLSRYFNSLLNRQSLMLLACPAYQITIAQVSNDDCPD